jgi:exodeoxyribonuclease VII large subunit
MDGQLELGLQRGPAKALTVTQLLRLVYDALEANLSEYWVVGEVSNARLAPSGHLYLTLKDARSAVNVVMFRSALERQRFKVSDGMQLLVRGRVGVFEARGALQFYAEEMQPRGLGALQIALEQLKQRLLAEGLFETARKRALPFLPRTIGLVTALRGAAVRDMLTVILKRYPNVHILIRPARVQGTGAAMEIAQALEDLNHDGRAEVIIVGRGGGSLEDLWAFNEEEVARAIFRSSIPVISAVGHEIDYTLADLVADCRAPTPTAAAQIVIPAKSDLKARIDAAATGLVGATRARLAACGREVAHLGRGVRNPAALARQARQRLDEASVGLVTAMNRQLGGRRVQAERLAERLRGPAQALQEVRNQTARLAMHLARSLGAQLHARRLLVARLAAHLDGLRLPAQVAAQRGALGVLQERLPQAAWRMLAVHRRRLEHAAGVLDSVSPLRVLERGYAMVTNRRDGRLVTDAAAVAAGDELEIRLRRGTVRATAQSRA